MAFETIHRPLFTESKRVHFPNDNPVSANDNGAFCQVCIRKYFWGKNSHTTLYSSHFMFLYKRTIAFAVFSLIDIIMNNCADTSLKKRALEFHIQGCRLAEH